MTVFLVELVKRARRARVVVLALTAVVILLVGAGLFASFDGVGYFTGLYWAITTATTVGYGDVTPHDTAARIIASAVMVTTIPIIGAIFGLLVGASVISRLRRLLGMELHLPEGDYTLIIGDHRVVTGVCRDLLASGDRVVLVAAEPPPGLPDGVVVVPGSPADEGTVRRARPERANRCLIACREDTDALIAAIAVHAAAPELEVYALSESPGVAAALRDLGVHHTISSTELLGHTLAKSLETPVAGDLLLTMVDGANYVLREHPIDPTHVARRLSEARAAIEELVLGLVHEGRLDLGVGTDPVIADGDRLIVLGGRTERHP